MGISQKCQYALRATFELARRQGARPTTVHQIAEAQGIPQRFLELILGQLRQGGFVDSRRGVRGGYLLASSPDSLTVGAIIRFVDGPIAPVNCDGESRDGPCPMHGGCAFVGLWERAEKAMSEVYDSTTFQDLLDEEQRAADPRFATYCI